MKSAFDQWISRIRDKLPSWFNLQNLAFFAVIAAFIIIVLWSESISQYFEQIRLEEIEALTRTGSATSTPMPVPEEWVTSPDQTNGIVFGAVILITIIIGGTAAILIRDRQD
jgi:type II secretory pathway component PulC